MEMEEGTRLSGRGLRVVLNLDFILTIRSRSDSCSAGEELLKASCSRRRRLVRERRGE